MSTKCSQVAHSECPWNSTHGEPLLVKFRETLGTLQGHLKVWMYPAFLQSFLKIYQKWFTMGGISRTFWMCYSGTFRGHCSGSFWVLLTGNTVIALLGTSQRKFWMSHSGKFWVLSLGKFWMFPWCSWWGHPGHMIWNTVNVPAISWPRNTAEKLVGNILNGLGMYQVGFCLVLCPCPCDGLVMYQPRTPPLAPSELHFDATLTPRHLAMVSSIRILNWFWKMESTRWPASIFVVLRSSTAQFRCLTTPCHDIATLGRSLPPLYIFSRVSTLTLVSRCPLPLVSCCFPLCLNVFPCVSMFFLVSRRFPLVSRCFCLHLNISACVSIAAAQ